MSQLKPIKVIHPDTGKVYTGYTAAPPPDMTDRLRREVIAELRNLGLDHHEELGEKLGEIVESLVGV